MKRLPVSSSRIMEIGYDTHQCLLEVRFRDNRIYHYHRVPERTFNTFIRVVSKGRFYDGVIKNKFPEYRIC
ncbi:KTSC domain-containing protein [Salmonella enterica subsp. enterica serovar Choleraesuis]|nr:KTSC domain-containing protein [Salmonella enterica subsp. enterica serovar Choleraesuis]